MKKQWLLYFILLPGLLASCSDEKVEEIYNGSKSMIQQLDINWNDAANKSTKALTDNFLPAISTYFGSEIGWDLSDGATGAQQMFEQGTMNMWSQSQALEILLDAHKRTGDKKYLATAENTLAAVYTANGNSYVSPNNAETEFTGLVLLRLYHAEADQTKKATYWTAVKELFAVLESNSAVEADPLTDQAGAYLNGKNGIPVSTYLSYKRSTASNAPAVMMATEMYTIANTLKEKADNYMLFAKNIYAYCGKALFDGSGLAYNTADMNSNGSIVTAQDKISYSANQGLMIGAALAIYKLTKEASSLKYANLFATYQAKGSFNSIRQIWHKTYPVFMPDYGSETLVGSLNRNIIMYRGIFFRYLAELIKIKENTETSTNLYTICLNNNVESMWIHGQESNKCLWGTRWYESPFKGEYVSTTEVGDPYISKKVISLEAQIAGTTMVEIKAALK